VIRANLTAFVPAIYAQGIARFRVQHVRIVRAWVGIDLRTNSNCEINDLEISHFDTGIWIDGSLDSIRISHLHDWPFECTPNQITALSDEANAGIRAGRTDGTHISDSLFHTGTGIIATASVVTTGKPVLYITNCSFDTYSGIKMTAGIVMVTNCGFGTFTASGYQAIHATASTEISALTVSNCVFTSNGGTGAVMELIGSASANALFVTLMGAGFNTAAGNQSSLRADSVAGGIIHLHVSQCHFSREGNVAYTAATISIGTNVRSIISNNMGTDKGTGAGTMVEVTTDGRHIITDNMFLGWSLTLPSTHTTISARGNTDAGGSSQYARGGEMQMGAHVYRTTSQTIPGSTVTVLTFDAERNDASGWHSTVTNTSRLTAPVAGWYLIGGTVEWATGNTVGARYALLILNGATQIAMAGGPVGTSAEAIQLTPAVAWYMNAGDYVELNLYQTSGGSLQILATPARSPEFWILRTGS
jgi:hypothetical protein